MDRQRGETSIPVRENEAGYPIYLSQKEYLLGNLDAAWALYDQNAAQLAPLLQKLRLDYCFWVLKRNVEKGEAVRVEELVKQMAILEKRENLVFSPEQQAELKLAYADVAFQKNVYGTARAWYRKVADNQNYKGSPQYYRALLGMVAVDREEKNYEDALRALDSLLLVKNGEVRIKAQYARALIYFAQEKYAETDEEIDAILRQDSKHADALLLRGKVQVKKRDLVSPTKIRIGMKRSTKAIEPGKHIEIELSDPSLSISGSGPIIEVEARAASGDVERMTLRSEGGKHAVYRAEVKTELGVSRPDDKVLQVLGRDRITYGFSKRFREQMKGLPPDPVDSVEIASDFELAIATGDFPPREGERKLTLEEMGLSTADQALGAGTIRPGNPFYVRVIDPDQSRTAGKDSLSVEVRSSSGDIIREFKLQETGPVTGEFQGAIPTASGQAGAYAYDSEPGRDPQMVISPRENYPGWQGRIGNKTWKKFFAVDLKDTVGLKTMVVTCPEARRPTAFLVQSSMNGQQWNTLGGFPAEKVAFFDGRPQRRWVDPKSIGVKERGSNLKLLPEDWAAGMERALFDSTISIQTEYLKNINGAKNPFGKNQGWGRLMHFQALFYQAEMGRRRFQVVLSGAGDQAFPGILLIDGSPSSGENASLIEREFKPGVHTVELWGVSNVGTLGGARLLCDGAEDKMVPCPDAMFDPDAFPPAIRAGLRRAATITEVKTGTYNIAFGENAQAQSIRLVIAAHAGDAPAIQRIALKDASDRQLLPVAEDYQALRTNQRLEVLPGDTVFVKYVDDQPYTEKRTQQEKRLSVAFNNASILASFIQRELQKDGSRGYEFENIRRFRMDDNVGFVITDFDMDVSDKRDPVPFKVKTSDGNTRTYTAYETEAHSGVFLGKVFPITGTPQRESEIQMTEGGTLTAIYRDMENLKPGVPADRSVTIEHAKYATPQFGLYTTTTEPVAFKPSEPEETKAGKKVSVPEVVVPRLRMHSVFLDEAALKTQSPQAIYNSSIRFDVIAPHEALAQSSQIYAYVQTEAGRKADAAMRKEATAAGKTMPDAIAPFDINVPGTLKLTGHLIDSGGPRCPDGYAGGTLQGRNRQATGRKVDPLDEGQFCFSVGLTRGGVPERSFATESAQGLPKPGSLAVQPGDKVHIGFAYFDKEGNAQWRTATVSLKGDAFLDVMNEAYNTHLTRRFVGERVYVRVMAPALDVSSEREEVTVYLETSSGAKTPFKMQETSEHSGVFKGNFKLGFAEQPGAPVTPQEFMHRGLPVRYGDTVTVTCEKALPPSFSFSVNNGADGAIESFSKRYTDSTVALETNFTLAECYFEEAKMHRAMGKDDKENGEKLLSASRRKMDHAKKLLEETMASFRDPELQAHAEYLLGNLAQEYADDAENPELKDTNYKDALARFSAITVDYPHSLFAPKAQYKKALVYEKMEQLDIAVEEYVKLGYKYPDNEFIPEAMSRIGGFFQKRGIDKKKESDEYLKKSDDISLKKGQELMDKAYRDFRWAANVYIRLQERYPTHPLAGWAGLRGGQNRMRYGDNAGAIEIFERVYLNGDYDGPDVRAQAMYWAGLAHEKLMIPADAAKNKSTIDYHKMAAIALYEVCRFQFSASEWAKHARGRLASESLSHLTTSEWKTGKPNALADLQARMLSTK